MYLFGEWDVNSEQELLALLRGFLFTVINTIVNIDLLIWVNTIDLNQHSICRESPLNLADGSSCASTLREGLKNAVQAEIHKRSMPQFQHCR